MTEDDPTHSNDRAEGGAAATTDAGEDKVAAYLARLHYDGPREPTLETLRALHRAHLYAVPFENLDVHHKRPIVLDVDRLFDKVVRGRGERIGARGSRSSSF